MIWGVVSLFPIVWDGCAANVAGIGFGKEALFAGTWRDGLEKILFGWSSLGTIVIIGVVSSVCELIGVFG